MSSAKAGEDSPRGKKPIRVTQDVALLMERTRESDGQ